MNELSLHAGAFGHPPGLIYRDGWLSDGEESRLLAHIDDSTWITSMSRRVQHYGWRYDYKARRVTKSDYLGPLPAWLSTLASRVQDSGLMPRPDQAIINEYQPGQGIAPHTDCAPCFGAVVAMISLDSPVEMDFDNSRTGEEVALLLQRRSILVLSGQARYSWRHGIARRRTDARYGIQRGRRVSITLRTVLLESGDTNSQSVPRNVRP